jgi:hypothetical protein
MHSETLPNRNLKYITRWARDVASMIKMKNAYNGLAGRNWNKEPLGKNIYLGGRITLKPVVNKNIHVYWTYWCYAVAQWLRHCATNRKVAGSFTDGVTVIFH